MQANDPTRVASSPIAGADSAVRLSRSETHALCAKAARGAGFDWGHAEAAGHAAQWLAARGLPGCDMLLQCLHSDAIRIRALRPSQDPGRPRCPLHLGTALADHATLPEVADQTLLDPGDVAVPGLLLPFLAITAQQGRHDLQLSTNDISVTLHTEGNPWGDPAFPPLCALARAQVRVTLRPGRGPASQPRRAVAELPLVARNVWRALDALALRVTVPSSTRSASGAGSEGSDND